MSSVLSALEDVEQTQEIPNNFVENRVTSASGRKITMFESFLILFFEFNFSFFLKKNRIKEATQFYNVIKHNAFKNNPFDTIQEHLKNSLQLEQSKSKSNVNTKSNSISTSKPNPKPIQKSKNQRTMKK